MLLGSRKTEGLTMDISWPDTGPFPHALGNASLIGEQAEQQFPEQSYLPVIEDAVAAP